VGCRGRSFTSPICTSEAKGRSKKKGEGGPKDFPRARDAYEKVANMGNHNAEYKVAMNEQHAADARRWFTRAAEGGHVEAQYMLGNWAFFSIGLPQQDAQTAIRWYTKAAQSGHAKAAAELGQLYATGANGVSPDYAAAAKWLTPGAEAGIPFAQYHLGALHYYGRGVPRNIGAAAKWLVKAAGQGHVDAQALLGEMYHATDPPDLVKARYWSEKAAAAGGGQALFALGVTHGNGVGVPQDKKKAMEYYVKAVKAGYWRARYDIAVLIVEGQAVGRDDAKAVRWLQPVAERAPDQFDTNQRFTIANAQWLLGIIYKKGANNVPADSDQAIYWFEKAARGGHVESQRWYGQMLVERQQYSEAATWLRAAAEKGDGLAQYNLGYLYLKGWGVAQSQEEGVAWMLRAYQQGTPGAKTVLNNLGFNAE
jgi:TPR repeat protein